MYESELKNGRSEENLMMSCRFIARGWRELIKIVADQCTIKVSLGNDFISSWRGFF